MMDEPSASTSSTSSKYCYFCNTTGHVGRECSKQLQLIVPGTLTAENIAKFDVSRDGNLIPGSPAPAVDVYDLVGQDYVPLLQHGQCGDTSTTPGRPLVISFGSCS